MFLVSYIQNTPLAFYIAASVFGLIIGSFLNVVIYRLPKMMERDWQQQCRTLLDLEPPDTAGETFDLVRPRSRCPQCGHQITALENIPVLSYLALGGKCSACKTAISIRYPVIEVLSGLLALFCAWHFGFGLQALLAILLSWALLTLSVIDIDHQLLPDDITLPFMWIGILANMVGVGFTNVYSSLFGVMAGYTILWTVYIVFKKLTGKEGMGYGDFKLLAMLGGWLGWQMLPLIILLSSLVGAVTGLSLIYFKQHEKNKPIPFGPYLAAAGWIALIWGNSLTAAYYHWAVNP